MILSFGAKRTASLLALIVAGAFAACGGDSAGTDIGTGIVVVKCTTSGDCKPGTHCGTNGECTVECSPTVPCASSSTGWSW